MFLLQYVLSIHYFVLGICHIIFGDDRPISSVMFIQCYLRISADLKKNELKKKSYSEIQINVWLKQKAISHKKASINGRSHYSLSKLASFYNFYLILTTSPLFTVYHTCPVLSDIILSMDHYQQRTTNRRQFPQK